MSKLTHFDKDGKAAMVDVSAKPDKAAEQILKRREQSTAPSKGIGSIPVSTIIEVLIEAIHAGRPRLGELAQP